MRINGKEYGLCMTVNAAIKVAKMCPGGDIRKYRDLMREDDFEKAIENMCAMAQILNEGFVEHETLEGRRADPAPEDFREAVRKSPIYVYLALQDDVLTAIARDFSGEVEVEEPKGAKRKKDETGAED